MGRLRINATSEIKVRLQCYAFDPQRDTVAKLKKKVSDANFQNRCQKLPWFEEY